MSTARSDWLISLCPGPRNSSGPHHVQLRVCLHVSPALSLCISEYLSHRSISVVVGTRVMQASPDHTFICWAKFTAPCLAATVLRTSSVSLTSPHHLWRRRRLEPPISNTVSSGGLLHIIRRLRSALLQIHKEILHWLNSMASLFIFLLPVQSKIPVQFQMRNRVVILKWRGLVPNPPGLKG
jgi:hypothetical protein